MLRLPCELLVCLYGGWWHDIAYYPKGYRRFYRRCSCQPRRARRHWRGGARDSLGIQETKVSNNYNDPPVLPGFAQRPPTVAYGYEWIWAEVRDVSHPHRCYFWRKAGTLEPFRALVAVRLNELGTGFIHEWRTANLSDAVYYNHLDQAVDATWTPVEAVK